MLKHVLNSNAKRHASFVTFIIASGLILYKTVDALVQHALHGESGSYIIIPLIAFFLLYLERRRIFSVTRSDVDD